MFKNNSDLDYLEWGLVHALDTNVRETAVEKNNKRSTHTDREIYSQVHLVGQSIYYLRYTYIYI